MAPGSLPALLLLALSSTAVAHAAPPAPYPAELARLDGYARGLADAGLFSGVVLIARDGELLSERAYGLRDENGDAPLAAGDRFNLASAGKMFTSVAILQQVAAGRLGLDTPVGEVLADYPNAVFARDVTVRHLLTHTGGAGDIDELFGAGNADRRARLRTLADMVALHGERPPAFPPGTRQAYGNYGYIVLGRMVEVLSGEDFEHYLRAHVFEPAGMASTGFVDCTDPAPDIAAGYVDVDGKRVRNCATLPARGMAAGGQVSTARDMLRFVQALQSGQLLPKALLEQATATQREFMGLGFFATDYGPDHPARDFRWGHGGSADGICTDVRTYPRTGETLVVLSNRDAPACYGVARFLHANWPGPD
ncbi:serine hydrolase domain-containing protein [Pseudoxanthomonas sp. 10H]|uniref:serine hydrolase domain-containing protein n=1 Tax=Pseudoxanthomonas sp. 10H TaxID=3242729 RepID=UPI0035569F37